MKLGFSGNVRLILLAATAAHIILYFTQGIVSTLEAEKYIDQAEHLINNNFPSAPKYWFYLPIIFLIALSKQLAFGYGLVVFAQAVFSIFSLLLFYKGSAKIFGDKTGFWATLALCAFLPFLSWNFYLYSESIFISFSMILFYAVCRFEEQKMKFFWLILFLVLVLIFTRPFGSLFVPPLFVYVLGSKYRFKRMKLYTASALTVFLILMFISIQAVFKGGEDMDAMKPFVEEHVVCFVPNKPEGANLELKYYDNGIRDVFYYIFHNPWHFTKLMAARLFSFFRFTRHWYSAGHNIALAAFIVPVYFFFFVGLFKAIQLKRNIIIYILSLLVLYPLATTLQCDDWHSRFTMPVLPPLFAIATYGLLTVFPKKPELQMTEQ